MRKIMTIVGTRPELIKMSRVIDALDVQFHQLLVHTGQNFDYELSEIFYRDLGIRRPDEFLGAAAGSPMETIANILLLSDRLMAEWQPEAVLIYGDTNSGLACIPAKRRKIPIFHFEAGNRSFDARVPEEINRRIIDHTSDVNLVLTEHARRYLLAEGFPADRIFKVGSHMPEVLAHARAGITASDATARLGLAPGAFFLVSAHREENVDDPLRLDLLAQGLDVLAERYGQPVVVSTHPRTRQRLESASIACARPEVRFLSPFGFLDYVRLQLDARCVISDSGTISEEAALLGFPAVTLREAHERPEGQEGGAVALVSRLGPKEILSGVEVVMATHDRTRRQPVPDYDLGPVSGPIVRIVSGYIDYVNRVVWSR
ncbi:UDP-2,3-diacetamido-2,3-dideoxy-D-glucuronate 2-epimerase [Methylobacterium tardum]|uniref:UDP-N-acetyl glucosamine 2-epimerase n=2 Tax=Methylobacterium tardum TaxID=374432 RepID=A0AA37WRF6_9HYPH|nr:UDP-N-acetyl glucosamine 2-epimerase [Methylobacterium tardum]GJE53268.1 UDP-2,3-diacetamido-2,3-dideoxy-D-glucuronate 2-epimerase [Methylobacterium tardum]GLS67993.1 UDP-N-acetyl glucosamine 2-epimerase [Methylobacterium tardum]